MRGNRLAAADGIDALVRLALDAHAVGGDSERGRDRGRIASRCSLIFGRLENNGDVDG